MSCDVRKWECQYCTYLNYQMNAKCIMCRSARPLQMIEEGAPSPSALSSNKEDGIISLKGLTHPTSTSFFQPSSAELISAPPPEIQGACHISPRASRVQQGVGPPTPSKIVSNRLQEASPRGSPKLRLEDSDRGVIKQRSNRWDSNSICPLCCNPTSINASSCKQCKCNIKLNPPQSQSQAHHHQYLKEPPSRDDDSFIPQSESLKISELGNYGNCITDLPKRPNCSTACPSPKVQVHGFPHPQGAEKCNSRSNSPNNANASSTNQEKWACPVCTYDNWPRSGKCVMCLLPRDQPGSISSSCTNTNDVKSGGSLYSQPNLFADSVIPPMASLSIGVSNNSTSNSFEPPRSYEDNAVNTNYTEAVRMRLFRGNDLDRRWIDACCGAVDGNIQAVEEYLSSGGDATRQLSEAEVLFLDRPSAFQIGLTLIHLSLRFHQEDVLATLLSQVDGNQPVAKRVPSYSAPNLALEIRRHAMASIRPRKGTLRCHCTSEIVTFTLPSEIDDMRPETQETLFDEILDRDVQKELENGQIINWSIEICDQLNSRLYALWNRSAGDCLLDSILQATWGIFDRDNSLRRALSDSLHDCATQFYQRWKESELLHARHLNFSLNEAQCSTDWAKLLSLASQPGSSLEQLHIFALAHILRRPIIVYGVKYVKSFRGEAIGFARYEGVYLPLLWEPSFCWRWPIALGYTRGHFSALVPMEPDCDPLARVDSATQLGAEDINERSIYLPLTTVDGALLPVQFLTQSEIGKEEYILGQWLDTAFTENGIMVARQRIQKRPLLVAQMIEEWLNHYRRVGPMSAAPYMRQSTTTCYSSEGESDND